MPDCGSQNSRDYGWRLSVDRTDKAALADQLCFLRQLLAIDQVGGRLTIPADERLAIQREMADLTQAMDALDVKESGLCGLRRRINRWSRESAFMWGWRTIALLGPVLFLSGLLSLFDLSMMRYPGVGILTMAISAPLTVFSVWILSYQD